MQVRRDDLISKISVALGVYYLLLTAYSIYAQTYYFADGAYFFLHIMESGDFMRLNPNRIHAHYATQFLPIAAIKIFGIKNYAVLSFLYGVNMYFPLIGGLVICYLLARNTNPYLMVFPLLSFFGLSMNSMLLIVTQAHVISSVFWPIIFYMTLKEKYSFKDSIIFFMLVLVFIKSYESALFLGPILAFVSFPGIFRRDGSQKVFWAAATLLFIAGVIIALREIIHPFDAGNRRNFILSVLELYKHYPAVLSAFFILIISLFLFLPGLLKKYFPAVSLFFLGLTLLVSFSPLVTPDLIRPYLQYNARVLMAYMVPLLGVLFYFIVGNRIFVSKDTWKRVGVLTAILIFGQISWNIIAVSQWYGFRKVFKKELTQHSGLLPFNDSVLSCKRVGNQLIGPFVWSWTVPTMSVLWSDGGIVSTIIINPDYTSWQPFDPGKIEDLPKVEQFGFSYETYRERPHELDRAYALNKKLIFSSGGNYDRYILNGWSFAEAGQVWTKGNAASLAFKMPDPLHDPIIDVEVIPFVVPPHLLKQRVTLSVNGEKVGELETSRPESIRFTVPRSIWLKKDTAVLEFMLPDAASPRSLDVNNDTRMIALAFRSLTIH